MKKIAGSGSASASRSISQRHGSADPDPDPDSHQNVMDPQHCFLIIWPLSSFTVPLVPCQSCTNEKIMFGLGKRPERREIIYCKRAILCLVFQNIDPPSPSPPGECVLPPTKAWGTQGDGGSIFWKTREIGLPSYSK
jgi:hypothetical protein